MSGTPSPVRSLQLYGVDPHYVGEAVRQLVGEDAMSEMEMFGGRPHEHDDRYRMGAEWIEICQRLWREETFDWVAKQQAAPAAAAPVANGPCAICGKGKADHAHADHEYEPRGARA